jgi:hypothetical protein
VEVYHGVSPFFIGAQLSMIAITSPAPTLRASFRVCL